MSLQTAVKRMANLETITAEEIAELVEAECQQANYIPIRQALTPYLVSPFVRRLRWSYEAVPKDYPCWVVADLSPCKPGLTLAYSQFGHGLRGDCWGIIEMGALWYGRDDSWFLCLEDAFINAGAWPEPLPEDYEIR